MLIELTHHGVANVPCGAGWAGKINIAIIISATWGRPCRWGSRFRGRKVGGVLDDGPTGYLRSEMEWQIVSGWPNKDDLIWRPAGIPPLLGQMHGKKIGEARNLEWRIATGMLATD